MRCSAIPLMLLAAAAPLPAADAQVSIRERITIRIPTAAPMTPIEMPRWVEKGGPKCLPGDQLAGAIVSDGDAVDLVMKGGARVRARLAGDCAALSYYGGFYIKPGGDGAVCAGRDEIRARSGASCGIKVFRKLIAKPAKH